MLFDKYFLVIVNIYDMSGFIHMPSLKVIPRNSIIGYLQATDLREAEAERQIFARIAALQVVAMGRYRNRSTGTYEIETSPFVYLFLRNSFRCRQSTPHKKEKKKKQ